MNILLTGSGGFLGRHLSARLLKLGHSVSCYTRDSALIPDLMDEEFGVSHLDVIIHAAAEITDKVKMWESNVVLTHKLLQFGQRIGVGRFIQIGSSSEYGNLSTPRREYSVCLPNDLYSATKLAATNLCLGFAAQYDMNVCVLRPFSLYGPYDTPRKLIPRLIESHNGGSLVSVNPDAQHDFLYVEDFIDGIITMLGTPSEQTKGQIVNFGSGVSSTNRQVVEAAQNAGLKPVVKYVKSAGMSSCPTNGVWMADTTKARERFDWSPKTSLIEGLKKIAS